MNQTQEYILALDQGTTSSRAIIFDHKGQIRSVAQKEFTQIFPQPGWVEHDPNEIWASQAGVAAEATVKIGINGKNIRAIGITNQRETTIVWNRETGLPVYNAIVWQDRRTVAFCDNLKNEGLTEPFRAKTGLIIDAYFSASKINWILNHVEGAKELANAGKLAFGTVDSWLVWKFTRGKVHVTDVTNASRTMLYNIITQEWDEELLQIFGVPKSMPVIAGTGESLGGNRAAFGPSAGLQHMAPAVVRGQHGVERAAVEERADGHTETLLKRAALVLSFGAMTWPHFLVRAMLAEQLYRAQAIAQGHPYHRAGRPEG